MLRWRISSRSWGRKVQVDSRFAMIRHVKNSTKNVVACYYYDAVFDRHSQ
jgi:hypothetical protein